MVARWEWGSIPGFSVDMSQVSQVAFAEEIMIIPKAKFLSCLSRQWSLDDSRPNQVIRKKKRKTFQLKLFFLLFSDALIIVRKGMPLTRGKAWMGCYCYIMVHKKSSSTFRITLDPALDPLLPSFEVIGFIDYNRLLGQKKKTKQNYSAVTSFQGGLSYVGY